MKTDLLHIGAIEDSLSIKRGALILRLEKKAFKFSVVICGLVVFCFFVIKIGLAFALQTKATHFIL